MSEFADLEYRVGKLELKPGEIVVLKINGRATRDVIHRLKEEFDRHFPGVRCLVLDQQLDIQTAALTDPGFAAAIIEIVRQGIPRIGDGVA